MLLILPPSTYQQKLREEERRRQRTAKKMYPVALRVWCYPFSVKKSAHRDRDLATPMKL